MWDSLWTGAAVATMEPGRPYGLIEEGAVGIADGRIAWVGPMAGLPAPPDALAATVHDAGGRVLTPGFVDCHTHVVHVGHRQADFELRIQGATRDQLTAAGGGIRGSVRLNRASDAETMFRETVPRIALLIASGVTTVECKSGYGLDHDTELRQLRVARELGRRMPITVKTSFLGAHGVAPEYDGRPDDYIAFLADQVLPAAAREGLVDAVDGFCDLIGFSHAQIGRLFDRATALGLPVKLHADQYTDAAAGQVVARYRGLSADHLEYVSEETVRIMAEAGTVATMLPGANYMLFETKRPPVALFRQYSVPMAVATNCNPNSSPATMPTMMMNLVCQLFRMTPEEAVLGFTRNGARALGLADRGTIAVGKVADLALWDLGHPNELPYRIAHNPCRAVVKDGVIVHRAEPPDLLRPAD